MIMRATSSMGMLKMSSRSRGKTWLLLSSRIVLPLSILPLAVFNLLPLKELDGHILLERALLCAFSPEKAARSLDVCEKILLIFIVPAAAVLVFSGYMSFSAIIFLFYLLAVDIFDKM